MFLLTGRFRTQSVLANLSSLAKQLAPMRGPKQIVFLSGGFPFGQDLLPLYNQFAAQAAEAQIAFYAVHLDGAGADVTIAKQRQATPYGGRDFAGGMGDRCHDDRGRVFLRRRLGGRHLQSRSHRDEQFLRTCGRDGGATT